MVKDFYGVNDSLKQIRDNLRHWEKAIKRIPPKNVDDLNALEIRKNDVSVVLGMLVCIKRILDGHNT